MAHHSRFLFLGGFVCMGSFGFFSIPQTNDSWEDRERGVHKENTLRMGPTITHYSSIHLGVEKRNWWQPLVDATAAIVITPSFLIFSYPPSPPYVYTPNFHSISRSVLSRKEDELFFFLLPILAILLPLTQFIFIIWRFRLLLGSMDRCTRG